MKFTLEHYRQRAVHMAASVAEYQEDLDRTTARMEELKRELLFLRAQIAEAEKRGLTAFDSERLLRRRLSK